MRRRIALLAAVWLLQPGSARAQLDVPPEPVLPPAPGDAPPTEKSPAAAPPTVAPSPLPPTVSGVPAAALPGAPIAPPAYSSVIVGRKPSPQWTQDRSFTSTRFWLLDPGVYEGEVWLRTRVPPSVNGVRAPAELLLQHEIEIGVVPHLQVDLYLNLNINQESDGNRHLTWEGYQIEARFAIPSYYGQIPTNPVIYLEWHGRPNDPDRVEVRLLLGGAPTRWLYLAANPYYETNVQASAVTDAGGKTTQQFIEDAEVGTTLAAGFRITDWFRVSAEMKIGADMLGDEHNNFHFVWWAGPGFILKPLHNERLKIMGTCLFALPGGDGGGPGHDAPQQFEPLLIVGSQF